MNKERLNKVAEFLDQLDESEFSYGELVKSWSGGSHPCGSVCCALGWFPKIVPNDWIWIPHTMMPERLTVALKEPELPLVYGFRGAEKWLDIDMSVVTELFATGSVGPQAKNIKPAHIAERIKHLLETRQTTTSR